MRALLLVALAALVLPAVAGCLDAATPGSDAPATTPPASTNLTAPKVSARETLDALKSFSEAYPYRQSGSPTHAAARDALEKMFQDAGLETMRQDFEATVGGAGVVPMTGQNVIGIKWGDDRSRWVVVGAHYDVTEGAVYGAYDDGSGTIDVAMLAKALAKVPTNRTIAFVEFDAEELGLVGSKAFVKAVTDGTFKHPVEVDAMLDLDMIGITWPHPAKLVCWENSATLEGKIRELSNATGVPEKQLEFRKPGGGSSDGAAFIAAGIPTAYFWSNWDEVSTPDGQVLPGLVSYPFWHQADTYEGMVALAGDEETLEKGFQTVLDITAPLVLYMASPAFVPDVEEPEK